MTEQREEPKPPIISYQDAGGTEWLLVVCPYCRADLSKVSMGRMVLSPAGWLTEMYWPIRCPECGHPLLPAAKRSKIATPRGIT